MHTHYERGVLASKRKYINTRISAPKTQRAKSMKVIYRDIVKGDTVWMTLYNLITHNAITSLPSKYLSVMNLNQHKNPS